jgi:hypothetical protein
MSNRQIYDTLEGLQEQITAHQLKIRQELQKDYPDQTAIRHWEREIRVWRERVTRLEQRLRRRQRRGR